MAKTRKGIAYSKTFVSGKGKKRLKLERPNTRKSKFRKMNYVRAVPRNRIVRFEGGTLGKKFSHRLDLVSKDMVQIRDIAFEAARQTTNRFLERQVGKTEFFSKIRVYPHHILRENPLASGAGADRMSTGMKKSFGKNIGIAARVKKGQVIYSLYVNEENLEKGRKALNKLNHKLPCTCTILTEKLEN